jgi:hypothetical protein
MGLSCGFPAYGARRSFAHLCGISTAYNACNPDSSQTLTRMGPTIAREIGRYSYDLQNSQKQLEKVEGKYVVLWRLVGGKWMLDTDIWNVSK